MIPYKIDPLRDICQITLACHAEEARFKKESKDPLEAGKVQARIFLLTLLRKEEAIQIRLHPDNLNRDNCIDFPDDWMPTVVAARPTAAWLPPQQSQTIALPHRSIA